MATFFRATILMTLLVSCVNFPVTEIEPISNVKFRTRVSFDRDGYSAIFPVTNYTGEAVFVISCYSLDDENREKFASENGTDPVADLSCYVKDTKRDNEYSVLGLKGESLQFSPGFFWLSEISKCSASTYVLDASARGFSFVFMLSNINTEERGADLSIDIKPMPSATNDILTDQSYRAGCT